jgi:hypothetical protein
MKKEEMTTMVDCIQHLREKGFTKDFSIKNGLLFFPDSDRKYSPEQVKIETFYRFEGDSDPSDNSILYAIITDDGYKGIISDAYGAYSNEDTGKFIARVESISKKETSKIH